MKMMDNDGYWMFFGPFTLQKFNLEPARVHDTFEPNAFPSFLALLQGCL